MGSGTSKDSENTSTGAQDPIDKKQPSPSPPSNMADEITSKLVDLTVKGQRTDINILLLGETGVGKSTFINSLFNYLQYSDFNVAQNSELNVFIPSTFSLYDKDEKEHVVSVGKVDKNELLELGKSATKEVKTYTFLIKNGDVQIRLIDTPGMGDTGGIDKDNENCEKILNYIGGLHELNAICYLCRPQNTRAHAYFKYCVTQIMSRLHADACKNFVFVFTGSRGSDYTPGDTYQMLKQTAEEIRKQPAQANLRLDDNKFCFDNESFRYLAGIKQGIQFTPQFKQECARSWKKSTDECWKMINYILDLKPHFVKQTSAINEARRIIYQLSQPMADISQLVNDNITLLQRHQATLDMDRNSLSDLKKRLYIPIIDLQVTNLTQPVTVCTNIKCSEVYKVGEKNEWHYKTRCHDPCYLQNVQKDLIGTPELINCAAMDQNQYCKICGCNYKLHMHVYYMTKKVDTEKRDDTVLANINTKESVIKAAQTTIHNIQLRKNELEIELKDIIKSNAKFAYFLQCNAITAFNDSYQEYINYLITRERGLGRDCDMSKLSGLQKLLMEHQEQKKIFNDLAEQRKKMNLVDLVTPQDISNTMNELFKLKHNGQKIKELYNSQKKSLSNERSSEEYSHKITFSPLSSVAHQKKDDDGQKKFEFNQGQSKRGGQYNRGGRGNFNNNKGRSSRPRGNSPPPPYDAHYNRHPNQQGRYGSQPSNEDAYRRPPPPHDAYRGPPPPHDGYRGPLPANDAYRGYPRPHDAYTGPPPPHDAYRGAPPPHDAYRGAPPPHDAYRGPPPPHDAYRGPPLPHEAYRGPQPPQDYYTGPLPQGDISDSRSYERSTTDRKNEPKIEVNVTLQNPKDAPPPTDSPRSSGDYGYYQRDPHYSSEPYYPRDRNHPRNDYYDPRDPHYDARYYDSRDPRNNYHPRDSYSQQYGSGDYNRDYRNYPRDDYYNRDRYQPQPGPSGNYPHQQYNHPQHNQHNRQHNNSNRNQNRQNHGNNNQGNNNYRGGGRGGGGIHKNYKKNRPNQNRGNKSGTDGNDSDTSIASSKY